MNDLKLKDWNYKESVERIKPKVYKLKTLTLEVYHELYTARAALSNQGSRTDLTSGQMSRSWESYCDEIGIAKRTANRWLERYDSENRKLIEAPKNKPVSEMTVDELCEILNKIIDEYKVRTTAAMEGCTTDIEDPFTDDICKKLDEIIDNTEGKYGLNDYVKLADMLLRTGNQIFMFRISCEQYIGKAYKQFNDYFGINIMDFSEQDLERLKLMLWKRIAELEKEKINK